jgi:hypothetical protein
MAFVLDASVAISWCFPGDVTEDTPYSRAVLKRLETEDAVVPEIWAFEIANSIFVSFSRRDASVSSRSLNISACSGASYSGRVSGFASEYRTGVYGAPSKHRGV